MTTPPVSSLHPPLDPEFQPLSRWLRSDLRAAGTLHLALERENGRVATASFPLAADADAAWLAERLTKFFLWSRGGWRLHLHAPAAVAQHLTRAFAPSGSRRFDVALMANVYGRPFEVITAPHPEALPETRETASALGGNLDGCRIGFDLGASDYKIAAVRDGEVVYSDEFPWAPREAADPAYHYAHLNDGLRRAAAHLPRVDAIGGSSAGVIVDNRFMVASLIRSIPADRFAEACDLFLRLQREWGVPFEVANDGDVTALAGALSLGVGGLLGLAMGSSEAAGYIDAQGKMTGWLNELAFAPVDGHPAAATDEWSGDRGVGALYFSQQAVNKLLPAAGIAVDAAVGLPERLKVVQTRMAHGDPAALAIYETIGSYLGHTLPLYARFYDLQHVLVLGRVTTGAGGGIVLDGARRVLAEIDPALAERVTLHLPDEKSRRVGQAVAAASLPRLPA